MNEETYNKFSFVEKSMRDHGGIKQIWVVGDRLKMLLDLYDVELFCDVWCSLEHEDANCIIGRLKRILNELKVQYLKNEFNYTSNDMKIFLEAHTSAFSREDYDISAFDAL